ncbi:MAG: hypothetical protein Q7U72_06525 [Brevundimonas sp.]|uniref:hypothetical protein n=1 Tax=Brevundimonas sp. TaxID=1871086 RepID=UPI002727B593|nr:hypothetical protein [Brevundimonas sp.]MDO9077090.1 hypothetical protein [Brevundimonas sp.]MDP3080170.1 hypothetical protein [Brevundimonas sp.]MDZ4059771.1 hypothetical protein [Brevundimonas sp.]
MADVITQVAAAPPLTVADLLADPAASFAIKDVARRWAARDSVNAALDARVLCEVFEAAADGMLGDGA